MLINKCILTFCASLLSIHTLAFGIIQHDQDGDGLIEIHTLAGLNAIRNTNGMIEDERGFCALENNTLTRCKGYELAQDLDFDTNQDGQLDAQDIYWNDGKGWLPLPNYYFNFIFEGNGHVIRNLMINRPELEFAGLFGEIYGFTFRGFGITGPLTSITGRNAAGLLAGKMFGGTINSVFVSGQVKAQQAGGLVGNSYQIEIKDVFSSASIMGTDASGGLLGDDASSWIERSFAIGPVSKVLYSGGLAGKDADTGFTNSYWAKDSTTQINKSWSQSLINFIDAEAERVSLTDLKCALHASDTHCVPDITLFNEWDENSTNLPNWVFTGQGHLPALRLNGHLYRVEDTNSQPVDIANLDINKDGILDYLDTDKDGLIDTLDDFPLHAGAFKDNDKDGLVDVATHFCTTDCLAAVGLTWDKYPNDTDNDQVSNDHDPDNVFDNGKPFALENMPIIYKTATAASTAITVYTPSKYFKDAVDNALKMEFKMNNTSTSNWQIANDSTNLMFSSGTHTIYWRAHDKSGNISEPAQQFIHVFPALGFTQNEYLTGEPSDIDFPLSANSAFPDIQYVINYQIVRQESTATTLDATNPKGFDLNYTANKPSISIGIAQDNLVEPDEHLVLKLLSIIPVDAPSVTIPIDPERQKATLTITDRNLAPINIRAYPPRGYANVFEERNLFLLEPRVTDPNGNDKHIIKWMGEGLVEAGDEHPNMIAIKGAYIKPGYILTVTATDNGQPALASKPFKILFKPTHDCADTHDIDDQLSPQGIDQILVYNCEAWPTINESSVASVSSASSSSARSSSASSVSSKSSSSKNASSTGSKTAGGSTSLWLFLAAFGLCSFKRRR